MKNRTIVVSIISLYIILSPLLLWCEIQPGDEDLPSGMTMKKVGGSRVVVPDGTRIRREGDLRIVEGSGEYAARNFVEIDSRFAKIEADIDSIKRDIEAIKNGLQEVRNSNSILKSK